MEGDLVAALDDRAPKLVGNFEQIVTGDSPEPKATQAFILFTVRNHAAPSIAEGWRLKVTGPGTNIELPPTTIPDSFTLSDSRTGKPKLRFHGKQALYEKAIEPIPRGGLVRGWLRFVFEGVDQDRIRAPGTRWSLSFADVTGKHYESDYVMSGKDGDPRYIPGAEQPFVLPGGE